MTGGTHNDHAPPFEFFARTYLPVVSRLGVKVRPRLHQHGFEPVGGGMVSVSVGSGHPLAPVALVDRGEVLRCSARAVSSRLPAHVASRELKVVAEEMGWTDLETLEVAAEGAGNALMLTVECRHVTRVVSSIGRCGLAAETVAARAVAQTRAYLDSGAPVGLHLADQLLLSLAVAGAGRFRTGAPSRHFHTNARIIERFLPVRIRADRVGDGSFMVTVD